MKEEPRSDSDLLETLTNEFLVALRDAGVLETFHHLQPADQTHFLRLIAMTDGRELRMKRIGTLVSAMKMSPLTALGRTRSDL